MALTGARRIAGAGGLWMCLTTGAAVAQTAAVPPPPTATSSTDQLARHPRRLTWAFHLDASWGAFGFADTLFAGAEPGTAPEVRDRWFEGLLKPGVSLDYSLPGESVIFGKLSGVGERTYGSLPAEYGLSVASFDVEDLAVGWRSGTALAGLKEDALEFTVGRTPFTIGQGFLVWDGATDGGTRGGFWTNGRKNWQMAAIGRFSPNVHTVEAFYLEKNELPDERAHAALSGVNYEWAPREGTTVGATYLRVRAAEDVAPDRAGMNVVNLRAFTAPLKPVPDLAFEFEYARERNGDAFQSNAWTLKTAYALSAIPWQPTLSYRYAWFQGDDPATARREGYDPLFLGFADWGTWWQGEIAGEYFIENSNLASHQVRLHLDPTASLGTGLLYYRFRLDQPASHGPGVTARDLASEVDWYMDWTITPRLTLSAIAAFADPGPAAEQASGRTRNLAYGMCYVSVSF
jgi:hypothetical protein